VRDTFIPLIKKAILSGGSPERLDRLVKQASCHPARLTPSQMMLAIVGICLDTGRKKQARYWLERLDCEVDPSDLGFALVYALRARQAHLALSLGHRLVAQDTVDLFERLRLAEDTVALACKLRIPCGRNGAWQVHNLLLALAADLVQNAPIGTHNEAIRSDTAALLARISRLQR
jgi:hypothetical protein